MGKEMDDKTGCGKCVSVCPYGRKECTFCVKCELYCPVDGRKVCGRRWSTKEVISEVENDISFYEGLFIDSPKGELIQI